ncbi:acyl-CoA dehydrogenase family protein [Antrihabitans sp. YC2-6]|uniref:acyl-CoA dehydrogenase family protein n=1 Tax=Antrihabitans sp. YC2-6 TaxID=2799498 RepID=UPI0018F62361|nr:acyl-CoA dehydrogenase family protein [Antrihabitans sp. YC2-6]MBJ8346429.1 acyl-CoA dehydrogenase family protein [Antrihabitans sp. YC2-6]
MTELLEFLLTESPTPPAIESVAAAWQHHRTVADRFESPVDIAAAAGFGADRLGYAFLSGYRAALQKLLPAIPSDSMVALCATESGGGHPSAIKTLLTPSGDGWELTGTKSFVTLGSAADVLIVFATTGTSAQGQNQLRAVSVDSKSPGVRIDDREPLEFAPEIPHAALTLDRVAVSPDDVLPGDAYSLYLKPFRTIEDLHVLAAGIGWLTQIARRSDWPPNIVERLLALLTTVRALAAAQASAASTHIALGGTFTLFIELLDDLETQWTTTDPELRELWARDRPLLSIAGFVRAKRLEAAWRTLTLGG